MIFAGRTRLLININHLLVSFKPLPSSCRAWDIFRIMERDRTRRDVHMHTSFQIIKICMYLILFAIVLSSLVVQKISLVIATSKLGSESNHVDNPTTSEGQQVEVVIFDLLCYLLMLWSFIIEKSPFVFKKYLCLSSKLPIGDCIL
jgi:hypothetical protein